MPDPTRQSVSASQAAALFNLSPYATRWLLHHHFRDPLTVPLDTRPDKRMIWGRKLQSAILSAAAEEYRLEVEENQADLYVRRGLVGCTRDGMMVDPATGPVVIEAKNVDAWAFKQNWRVVPAHIEIQVQCEMYAMDCRRAIIAVLVGGNDLKFFERVPEPELIGDIIAESERFFADLAADRAPDAAGAPVELAALSALYAERDEELELDVTDDPAFGDDLRQYAWAQDQRLSCSKIEDGLKPKILARAQNATRLRAMGARARIRSTHAKPGLCGHCGGIIRAGGVRTSISVQIEDALPNFLADAPGFKP